MRRDERIVVFGEDVADATRDEALREGKLKGKGGVFKLTSGLQTEFGNDRVLELAAGRGEHRRPRDWHGGARTEAGRGDSVLRLHLAGDAPDAQRTERDALAVERTVQLPAGDARADWRLSHGGSIYHSQSGESIFTHTPGVRVVMPSNALDAAGLLRTAIRCDDPVLFLEHKRLYRETFGRAASIPGRST